MGHLFSRHQQGTAQDRAVLSLKVQRDKLKQYQKRMETLISNERRSIQSLLKNADADDVNKERHRMQALYLLRKTKVQNAMLEKSDAHLMNLQGLLDTLEYTIVESQVVQGLKEGGKMLEILNKALQQDLKSVEATNDNVLEDLDQVDQALKEMGGQIEMSDEQLLSELETLEAENIPQLPDVPQKAIVTDVEPQKASVGLKQKTKVKQQVAE